MGLVSYLYGGTYLGEKLRWFLLKLGVQVLYNKSLMKKLRDNPTEYMRNAQCFFSENVNRVENVKNLLADEKSKDTFMKLIHQRQFYEEKDIPDYDYFNQYFPDDINGFAPPPIQHDERLETDGEVFVDCGAFNGDSINMFVKKFHNYKSIVAFEPNNVIAPLLEKRLKKYHDVKIINKGVSNINGKVFFTINDGGSKITKEDNGNCVFVTRIDDCEECKDVTFIKMDVEGAEMEALHGAEGTIKRNRPKLAISIYHSDEDMLRIAEYIHDIVPEYKLYVRAHTCGIAETVLYAVV